MTRQPSLLSSSSLPPPFEEAWTALERLHGKHDVVEVDTVVFDRGRTTIALRIAGKKFAVLSRSDLEVAARDLFTQVYGPIAEQHQ